MTPNPAPVTASDAERAAFEAWAGTLQSWVPNVDRIHPSGPYKSLATASAWSAWKARSALPIDFKQATDQGGWQWVPKEPTREMQDACLALVDLTTGDPEDHRYNDGRDAVSGLYRAMLAAAPTLQGVADGDAA